MQWYRGQKLRSRTIKTPNDIIKLQDISHIVLRDQKQNIIGKAIVDTDNLEKVSKKKWSLTPGGYVQTRLNGGIIQMHRYLFGHLGQMLDHINRNPLDNRRENIRPCTKSQNMANRPTQRNNTSGVPGVVWDKSRNKWVARVKKDGKTRYIGRFSDKAEATKARNAAVKELFGEFAYVS